MGSKIKEIKFFIDKVRFLKLKIVLSSFIKFVVKSMEILTFILLFYFLYQFVFTKKLDIYGFIYVLILYAFCLGMNFLDTYYSHAISYDVIEKLRENIFEHYDRISPGAVEHMKSGDFIQMIVNDINVFEWFIAHILTQWISFLLLSFVMISMIIVKSVLSGVIFSAFVIFILRLFLSMISEKEKQGIEIKNAGGDLIADVTDGISGFKELVFFNREKDFFEKIELKSKAYNDLSKTYFIQETKVNLWIDICAILILPIVGMSLQLKGFEAILYVFAVILYFLLLRDCMHQTGNFGFVFGALNRLKRVYDIEPIVKTYGKSEINKVDIDRGIEFVDCSFYYAANASNFILNKVGFKVNKGEKTVVVAASGGGKSTIFKLINRYYELNDGEIRIFGENLQNYTYDTLRENITTINQENFLFHDTLLNNLKYAKEDINMLEIERLAQKINSLDFILSKEKGFETMVDEAGANYSGGELQRLAILRALIKDSPILLMDEASSALDEKNEKILNTLLDEIKENKIIIIAAHKLSTIQKADKIILLKDARVVCEGSYEELLQNHYFNELVMVKECKEEIEV